MTQLTLTGVQTKRMQQLHAILIETPDFRKVYEAAALAMATSGIAAEPSCLLTIGLSGSGKSTIAKSLIDRNTPKETTKGRELPVLFVDVPAAASANGLAIAMLSSLGDPAYDRGSVAVKSQRLYKLLHLCKVKLIILDEFHHLIDEDQSKVLKTSADWLKTLINQSKIPVFLLGIERSRIIFDVNEQLRRRFSRIIELAPYDWENAASQLEFRKLMKTISLVLPFDTAPDLSSPQMAFTMYQASSGLIGHVMRLLRTASEAAILNNETTLSASRLASAYQDVVAELQPANASGSRPNPFTDANLASRSPIGPGSLSEISSLSLPKNTKIGHILSTR